MVRFATQSYSNGFDKPDTIERILTHLELPTEPPRALPARAPPEQFEFSEFETQLEEVYEEAFIEY